MDDQDTQTTPSAPVLHDAGRLVTAYIRIRDARTELKRKFEADDAALEAQLDMVESNLLEICKHTGQNGGRTDHGTFTRTVRTRYWTNDWASMHDLVRKHDAFDLLERRISQSNMAAFLEAHPSEVPPGLNVDSKYSITVRRKS